MITLPNLLRRGLPVCVLIGLVISPIAAKDPDPATKLKEELKKQIDEDDDEVPAKERYGTKVETPLVGEYTTFAGLTAVKVEGVGLVVGLRGTGGNPAPSPMRTALVEDLKRRNVRNVNEILKSPDTALVYLRAYLPPLLEKGETIDVQVWIPDSAEATGLEGGWLMEAYLSEQAFVAGKGQLAGHHFARAKGPVLTAAIGENKKDSPALLRRGLVLGGATVVRERELSIYLRNDFRSIRNSTRIAEAISRRFHDFDKHGIQQPMATARNDQKIKLLVHPKYKNNFPRYLQVIRHLAFREPSAEKRPGNKSQPVARRLRLDRLKDELQTPEKSEQAALQLEGIGTEAIPILKAALATPILECRFHAASALAYLGEADGVAVLAEVARQEPAFRVFALAALSIIEDADAHIALRKLMREPSMELRYGAFRALWVLDKNDPFIQGETIKVMEGKSGYMLHEVDTQSEPLVHLTTRTRPEVVLFGTGQKLKAPLYLMAGKNIMIKADAGAQTASIRRFSSDQPDERREVSLNVADVIRGVSELDATYPDVVQMLTEAAGQNNLEGRFTHDALPEGGRMYERPPGSKEPTKKGSRKTRIGRENSTPNMFSRDPEDQDKPKKDDDASDEPGIMTNVAPEKQKKSADDNADQDKSKDKKPNPPEPKKEAPKKEEAAKKSRLSNGLIPRIFRKSVEPGQTEPEINDSSLPEQSEPR